MADNAKGGTGHFGFGQIQSPKESENKDGSYTGGSSKINKGSGKGKVD